MATATNVREFNLGIDRFRDRVSDEVYPKLVRAVGLEGLRRLVLATRVDTGRARGNWQSSEGEPATGAVERFDQAGSRGNVDTVSLEGRKILAMEGDEVIWLHNGVPYIGILEDKDKMLAGTVHSLRVWLRSLR